MDKKVSVIVPMYQAEKTIEACIYSIEHQTYHHMEIIIVDDGSTDKSWELVQKCKEIDERIIMYHQTNQGVSVARNQGLALASGEYYFFVDADDTICEDYCEKMLKRAEMNQGEIVISSVVASLQNGMQENMTWVLSRNDMREKFELLYSNWVFHSVCGKLYKKELVQQCQFQKNVRIGEDLLFNFQYFNLIKKAVILPNVGYCYNENSTSAVHRFCKEDFYTQKILRERSIEFYREVLGGKGIPDAINQVFLWNVFDILMSLITNENRDIRRIYAKEYTEDVLVRNLSMNWEPETFQRKVFRWAVLEKKPVFLLGLGKLKKIKRRIEKK